MGRAIASMEIAQQRSLYRSENALKKVRSHRIISVFYYLACPATAALELDSEILMRQVYQAGFWIKIEWKAPGRPHVRLSRGHLGLHDMLFRPLITILYIFSASDVIFMLYITQYVIFF